MEHEIVTGEIVDEAPVRDSGRKWSRLRGAATERVRRAGLRTRQTGVPDPDNPQDGPRVFISYSRRDKIAADVCEDLRQHGAQVWVDTESITGGEEWSRSISRGIRDSDVFVVLISPNVARHPNSVLTELGFASSAGTRIIPVRLKRMTKLPEGFDLFLAGKQWVDLFPPNYASGIEKLVAAIGESQQMEPGSVGEFTKRLKGQIRRVAHDHEIGSKVRKYGGAVIGGAALGALVVGKSVVEQQERQRQDARRQKQLELERYLERTSEMLARAMSEIRLTDGMTREEYRDDFRPAFSRILGQLEATRPNAPAVEERHQRLVAELQRLMDGFDAAAQKADNGDQVGYQRSIVRLNAAWAKTISSMLQWLNEAASEAAA
jgi:hypothetical protein